MNARKQQPQNGVSQGRDSTFRQDGVAHPHRQLPLAAAARAVRRNKLDAPRKTERKGSSIRNSRQRGKSSSSPGRPPERQLPPLPRGRRPLISAQRGSHAHLLCGPIAARGKRARSQARARGRAWHRSSQRESVTPLPGRAPYKTLKERKAHAVRFSCFRRRKCT